MFCGKKEKRTGKPEPTAGTNESRDGTNETPAGALEPHHRAHETHPRNPPEATWSPRTPRRSPRHPSRNKPEPCRSERRASPSARDPRRIVFIHPRVLRRAPSRAGNTLAGVRQSFGASSEESSLTPSHAENPGKTYHPDRKSFHFRPPGDRPRRAPRSPTSKPSGRTQHRVIPSARNKESIAESRMGAGLS